MPSFHLPQRKFICALSVLLLAAPLILAQACVENTNSNCQLGALPQDGSTEYYAPDDSSDFELIGQALGTCDTGSSADVQLYSTFDDSSSGNFIADCGCLPLDGNVHTIDCAGTPRNTYPDGGYHFVVNLNPAYEGLDRFYVTHTQSTVTAATPTSTVTSTTSETTTTTSTSTSTVTSTSPQVTVTTPASTISQTTTITPSPVTTTTTSIKTYTRNVLTWTIVQTTKTITKQCTTMKPLPTCSKAAQVVPRYFKRGSEALVKRQSYQDGYSVADGPLTTTTTPAPVIATTTVDGGTTTVTNFATTTTTTTVPATPATTTVYAGTLTAQSTTTLSTVTSTATLHTTTHITDTFTETIVWVQTSYTTPVCSTKTK